MSDFLQPSTLEAALQARAEHPDYLLVAGGTDVYVASKDRQAPLGMIDLFGIPRLCDIVDAADGGIRVGAATTYADLLADSRVAECFPVLHAACREIGAAQIQARGTIGGNVITSSPVGDALPPLLALDAEVEVASKSGTRRMPYGEFHTGYRKVDLAADELLVAIHLPPPHAESVQCWRKVGTRRAQSISKVMMAAVAHLEEGVIARARISLGAVADRTIRALKTEECIVGQAPNEQTAQAARLTLHSEISPIDDLRSSARYRLGVAENLVARFILSLADPARPE